MKLDTQPCHTGTRLWELRYVGPVPTTVDLALAIVNDRPLGSLHARPCPCIDCLDRIVGKRPSPDFAEGNPDRAPFVRALLAGFR